MDYQIGPHTKKCFVSGKEISPGDSYYTAVIETVTGLERRDYRVEHWTGPPEEALGFWRSRLPEDKDAGKPKPVTVEAMLALFEQFAEETEDPKRRQLHYVLALLLMRRKALKLHDVQQDGEHEVLIFRRPRSKENLPVMDPGLKETEVDRLEEELAELLGTAPSPSE
ncbi:hypothetical protein Pan216_33880 [Planctomycetes bacterium Pan216]|uniref:Uncharacterized protein n=1 Tax=Kolteria novifilia TaxID=2527975 RepID=A0A518B6B8_9BACT|nr:hypothetical protein Pan216_33880 [Planctomycetes bacterium Pan216]